MISNACSFYTNAAGRALISIKRASTHVLHTNVMVACLLLCQLVLLFQLCSLLPTGQHSFLLTKKGNRPSGITSLRPLTDYPSLVSPQKRKISDLASEKHRRSGRNHCGRWIKKMLISSLDNDACRLRNVITVIRMAPNTLLMGLTCFKLCCGACNTVKW